MKATVRRQIGIATGLALGIVFIAVLCAPGCEHMHARGPMNVGHGEVACAGCHVKAPGTVRQQLQRVVRVWIGLEHGGVDVGFQHVGNAACTRCHKRPQDRHPSFRFLEPRFAAVREALHPERCESCHQEHAGVRVTTAETTYCRHCHGELVVKHDTIDVPHAQLVAAARWETCLGCHDYHGNHAAKPPRRVADAVSAERIRAYFAGGASPYGAEVLRATEATR
jgi:hypothetical protein